MDPALKDSVRTLLNKREQYVIDAVVDTAVRDEQMSDNGKDSLYADEARFLRKVEQRIKNGNVEEERDFPNIVDAILRYELNKADW